MLVRRRKVRIEIEQKTVRMEVSSNSPAVPAAPTSTVEPTVEPKGATLLNIADGDKAKTLKSGEAL